MRHKVLRSAGSIVQKAFGIAIRTVVTMIVFGVCTLVTMHYMGVPIPSAEQVFHNIESITRLSRLLS